MNRPTMEHEQELRAAGFAVIAGVDEVGIGPLAGPVCAAAVILPDGFTHQVLNDSKQLSEKQRAAIYAELAGNGDVHWQVEMVGVDEIDRINILQAARLAMRRAVLGLAPRPDVVLIDGRPVPDFPTRHRAIVKGDRISLSIAAASVMAKVTRDRFMIEMASRYPAYGFAEHKGYSTRTHLDALRRHGPCPIHRRSFEPVSQLWLELKM